jgi:hypothetical protein
MTPAMSLASVSSQPRVVGAAGIDRRKRADYPGRNEGSSDGANCKWHRSSSSSSSSNDDPCLERGMDAEAGDQRWVN